MADPLKKIAFGNGELEYPIIRDRTDQVDTLLAGRQNIDPKLFEALGLMNDQLSILTLAISPIITALRRQSIVERVITAPPEISYTFGLTSVNVIWTAVSGAAQYELREGIDWDTASFILRTTQTNAQLSPMLVGNHTLLIKSVTSSGVYSVDTLSLLIVVPPVGAVTLTSRSIDNNILLNWTAAVSVFAIDYYILRRENSILGTVKGNFTTYFELIAGTYDYSISAVDIAGNEGPLATVTITLTIPADFVLESVRISALGSFQTSAAFFVYVPTVTDPSDVNFSYIPQLTFELEVVDFYYGELSFSSTLVNVISMPGPSLLCCWTPTTWAVHFTGNTWLTPKNQVDAGYPIYIEPASLTGSYEEIYDYGAMFANVIVTVTYRALALTASGVGVIVKMAMSDDGITYSPYVAGASQFYPSIRFMKLKLEFTGATDKSLIRLSDLTITLNVKKEMDSGHVVATASDVGGTEVLFTKPFKDVDSITLSVESIEPVIAIYDFTDVPNPVHFFVYTMDTTGNRITYPVSWKARGVV